MAAFARRLPQGDGRLAVLGHSMGSDIAVRYAQGDPEVAATIAVSMFSMVVTATSPRNLLVIDGALEPSAFRNNALRVVAMTAGAELPAEQDRQHEQVKLETFSYQSKNSYGSIVVRGHQFARHRIPLHRRLAARLGQTKDEMIVLI